MKIGQRVRVINIKNIDRNIKYGDTGTVVAYKYDKTVGTILGVEMDRYIKGHDCDNRGQAGFCVWIRKKKLQPISAKKIDVKEISNRIVKYVCENSEEGSYIVSYIDISDIISKKDFIRLSENIVKELNKNEKVADADLINKEEIDITVWKSYLKK